MAVGKDIPDASTNIPGPRSRQPGIRYGYSGSGTGAGPEPVPGAEHLNPGPDGRDPRPENGYPRNLRPSALS